MTKRIDFSMLKSWSKNTKYQHTNIDHLRISLVEKIPSFSHFINLLDSDNSSETYTEIWGLQITLTKIFVPIGVALIGYVSFCDIPVRVVQYVEFSENTKNLTKKIGKLEVYGSYFRLNHITNNAYDLIWKLVELWELQLSKFQNYFSSIKALQTDALFYSWINFKTTLVQ